ncbi:uncharacterized protein HD556DRAFT_171321 [Suillus plorans]|uniref:Uncharacterized protein n=1 Tax=Suillus plorans TaxID=116603 RepID=A0A9P7A9L5_9AGAM|nr:uncharacterized protein HD556DRAFT_171321 [Suillus plorans]KAG1784959.1 hypothetical protein HD556DRAFT_171321 [Suillus plorans]
MSSFQVSSGCQSFPQHASYVDLRMAEVTGKVDLKIGDDTYQTWYKIVGDLASGAHPLIILHGGPDVPHEYITPLAEFQASSSSFTTRSEVHL